MSTVTGPICHPKGVRGYGDPADGVIIIGIAPGADEAMRTKRPFTGPSGQLLDQLLKYAGWSRDRVYTTNVVCWQNNSPSSDEIEECGLRFRHELSLLKPKLIVTAGVVANEAVTGIKRRKGSRGSVTWSPRWNAYVLDTHHPSFALQAQSMSAAQDIIRDFTKIPSVLEWPPDGSTAQVSYLTVNNLAEAQDVLRCLPTDTPVALDIETSNPDVELIDAYKDQLLCFAVSYLAGERETTVVFPGRIFPDCVRNGTHVTSWRTDGYCNICGLPEQVLEWPEHVPWTFQLGQFDIPALANYFGTVLHLANDTVLLSHCTDERPGYHGLKPNAREWLGAGWYEEKVKPFYKGKMHLVPEADVHEYNARDAAYTRRLQPIYWRKAQEDGTDRTYTDLLLPATQTFITMQMRGINVDQKVLQELAYDTWYPRYVQMYRDLQLEAQDIGWPTDDLNFNSVPQLRKLFYQIIGIEPTKFTPKGRPSLDKEVLERLDHPFAAKIRAFRTLDTMTDYVLAVYNNIKRDGLLHPSAFVTTTRTGRTSYRDPAMQTLPKDYTVGADYARLREIIIPHNPDTHEIIEADFNQIEVWLAWAASRDPTLLTHLQSGDVHSATAEGAFNTKRELWSKEDWDKKRQNAKKIRFGQLMQAEVKPAQLLEALRGNQQPEWLGTATNGSETDSASRTEAAATA